MPTPGKHSASDWRGLIAEAISVLWPQLPAGVAWIESQVAVESGGDPLAQSPVGAQGLLQLMPLTAMDLGVGDPFDPAQNLNGGIRYLKQQYDALAEIPALADRLRWAFAAFNGGRGYLDFNGGPINTCLELARADEPGSWWRWEIGRRYLFHRDLIVRGRRPDYHQIWNYVARIEAAYERIGGQP